MNMKNEKEMTIVKQLQNVMEHLVVVDDFLKCYKICVNHTAQKLIFDKTRAIVIDAMECMTHIIENIKTQCPKFVEEGINKINYDMKSILKECNLNDLDEEADKDKDIWKADTSYAEWNDVIDKVKKNTLNEIKVDKPNPYSIVTKQDIEAITAMDLDDDRKTEDFDKEAKKLSKAKTKNARKNAKSKKEKSK